MELNNFLFEVFEIVIPPGYSTGKAVMSGEEFVTDGFDGSSHCLYISVDITLWYG